MSNPTLKTGHPLETGQMGMVPSEPRAKPGRLDLKIYRALTRMARPLAPFILSARERRGKEEPERRGERLGRASRPRPEGELVWVHAASVGETSAVLPLIEALLVSRPDLSILLTTGTVTSAAFAARRLPGAAIHQYVPLDSPSLVGTFLDHWQPSLGVFTEQEVWPNLVIEADIRGIPLALVNARMSDASFERWQKRIGLAEALFSRFDVVLAQNDRLTQRFQLLGAQRAIAAGNLKIDAPAPPVSAAAYEALQAALGERRRLVVASTHDGEEVALAQAHAQLKADFPDLVTIIAPRHPERGPAVAAAIEALGLSVARRAAGGLPGPQTDIYVADTIGELGTLYALAPVAFIGGSLVPHGGQNPIEAVRHGSVVVAGPFTHNFTDAFAALNEAGGAVSVAEAGELPKVLGDLLGEPERLASMRDRATQALTVLSGALERTVSALLALLPEVRRQQASGHQEAGKRVG